MIKTHSFYKPIVWLVIAFSLYLVPCFFFVYAQTSTSTAANALQQKIDQRNSDIKALEAEIAKYQVQIDDLGSQATSLSSTIKSLQLTQKKLEANIALTQEKIASKTYEIQKLGTQINGKQ